MIKACSHCVCVCGEGGIRVLKDLYRLFVEGNAALALGPVSDCAITNTLWRGVCVYVLFQNYDYIFHTHLSSGIKCFFMYTVHTTIINLKM